MDRARAGVSGLVFNALKFPAADFERIKIIPAIKSNQRVCGVIIHDKIDDQEVIASLSADIDITMTAVDSDLIIPFIGFQRYLIVAFKSDFNLITLTGSANLNIGGVFE